MTEGTQVPEAPAEAEPDELELKQASLQEKRDKLMALKAEEQELIETRGRAQQSAALDAEAERLDAEVAEMQARVDARKKLAADEAAPAPETPVTPPENPPTPPETPPTPPAKVPPVKAQPRADETPKEK